MPGSASYANARNLYFSATPITGVTLTGATPATLVGELADGSDIGDPEVDTEETMGGAAATRATMSHTFRILGGVVPAALVTAKDANGPTDIWFYVTNNSLTSVTRYGPMKVTSAFAQGNQTDPKRRAVVIMASGKADTPEDMMVTSNGVVVVPV